MEQPSRETRVLERFWRAATTICTDVALLQPDLTAGLLHTGWAGLFAARVLWEHVCSEPFPPALPINFGTEKKRSRMQPYYYDGPGCPKIEGWFFSWLARQLDWQQQLQELVAATGLPAAPRRVLIVDEFIGTGVTRSAVMGLFLATFPGVKPRFMGWMAPAWKAPLVRAWKARFLPQILPHTENAPEQDIDSLVGRLASGTEDVHPDSLYWQRISRDGDLMTRLTHYLPYEFWLGCPAWINTTIANYIRERADQTDWSPEFTLRENRNQSNSSRVNHVSLLWQEIFTHGQITHRKASRILRIPPKKSRHLLERMARRDELCKVGAEPMPHFTLPLPEIIDRVKARRQNRELWHGY